MLLALPRCRQQRPLLHPTPNIRHPFCTLIHKDQMSHDHVRLQARLQRLQLFVWTLIVGSLLALLLGLLMQWRQSAAGQ